MTAVLQLGLWVEAVELGGGDDDDNGRLIMNNGTVRKACREAELYTRNATAEADEGDGRRKECEKSGYKNNS